MFMLTGIINIQTLPKIDDRYKCIIAFYLTIPDSGRNGSDLELKFSTLTSTFSIESFNI